jgi:peptidoglycan hydrolase-like protein with peptidoglycan-binding domain
MSSRHPDPRGQGRARRLGLAAGGLVLAAGAGLAAVSLWPGEGRPAQASAAVPVAVAAVVRTDVSARQVVSGILGYRGSFSVVNELPAGVVTWLPGPGRIVRRGQALFQLAGQPVTLLYGPVPAWRAFGPGMTPGPDVRELQRNLAALGFSPGPSDGRFGWATGTAIDRWQQANGMPETGIIPLGELVFLPGPLRITTAAVPLGAPAGPGASVLTGTSDTPSVSVSLNVGGPAVQPGDSVVVTMPDGTTTVRGTITSVGRVATVAGAAAGPGTPQAVIPVTISIGTSPVAPGLDQAPVQVAITQQQHRGVLAVPVTALLALPGGGYAVQAASGSARHLIPVATGLFDDATGLVEVSGPHLTAGLTVAVAQG